MSEIDWYVIAIGAFAFGALIGAFILLVIEVKRGHHE